MLLLCDKICALKICFLENKAPGEDRDKLCRFREVVDGPLIAQREGSMAGGGINSLEVDETVEMIRMKWTTIYMMMLEFLIWATK